MAELKMKDMVEKKCTLEARRIVRRERKIANHVQKARKF